MPKISAHVAGVNPTDYLQFRYMNLTLYLIHYFIYTSHHLKFLYWPRSSTLHIRASLKTTITTKQEQQEQQEQQQQQQQHPPTPIGP